MKLLVVDDDPAVQSTMKEWLSPVVEPIPALSLQDANTLVTQAPSLQLILLDEFLPDGSGLAWYRSLLSTLKTPPPSIVITRNDMLEYIDSCYSTQSVLDYILKPLDRGEVVSKVKRALKLLPTPQNYAPATISVNNKQRTLTSQGKTVCLTPNEFALCTLFSSRCPAPLSRDEIIKALWGEVHTESRTLHVHMSNLRKKILLLGIYIHYDKASRTFFMEFPNL